MKVTILGDQPVYCAGLASIVAQRYPSAEIVVEADPDALLKVSPDDSDFILVDLAGPAGSDRLEALKRLANTSSKVAVFSDYDSPYFIRETMDLGIRGFIPKSLSVNLILNALSLIEMGGRYVPDAVLTSPPSGFTETPEAHYESGAERLTQRQREVWMEVGKGRSNQEIALALGIAVATVKLHVNAVLKALSVRNRTEAALLAQRILRLKPGNS